MPGVPNVAAPYYRSLTVQYTDAFGQPATLLSRNVVVTGVQAGTATFTTVSPRIPLLVLHDPPGDNSFSFWNRETVQERALRFYAASSNSAKDWLEVKSAPNSRRASA